MNTNEILSVMTSGENKVKAIQEKFFNVVLEPARVSNPLFSQPENTYFVYNEKSGLQIAKKSVGKDFNPMQQQEFLDNILATIHEFGADLDLDTLQFNSYNNDSKIEFSIRTKLDLNFKNYAKLNDVTQIELTFSTSYDGTKSNRISLFTRRLVCMNGMTVREIQGELKGRNTLGGKTKILSYAEEVAQIINGIGDYKAKMVELDKKVLTKQEIEDFKLKLFGYNTASLLASDKNARQLAKPMELLSNFDLALNIELPRTGSTAFGLLQSVTYYTNHIANANGKAHTNDEFIRFGTGASLNDEAQKLIYAMV